MSSRAFRFDFGCFNFFFSSTLLLLASSADGSGYSSKLYQSKTIPVDWNCEYFVCVQFGRNRKWVQCRWAKLKQYTIDSLLPGRFSQVRIENQCIVANRVPLSFLLIAWQMKEIDGSTLMWTLNTKHFQFCVVKNWHRCYGYLLLYTTRYTYMMRQPKFNECILIE